MKATLDTPDEVCAHLARLCRGRGLYAATPASLGTMVDWGSRYLAGDPEGWSALLLRAWCHAEDVSFASACRERGWSPTRGWRAWRGAASAVARGLAEDARDVRAMD